MPDDSDTEMAEAATTPPAWKQHSLDVIERRWGPRVSFIFDGEYLAFRKKKFSLFRFFKV